jgi:hypothetical protein
VQHRTIRSLLAIAGASLLLILAMTSSALASSTRYLVPGAYPATLVGESSEAAGINAGKPNPITCKSSTVSGVVNSPTDLIAVTPGFSGCEMKVLGTWRPATVSSSGCAFLLHPGTEDAEGHVTGTVDIGPTGCGPITAVAQNCEKSFGAQSNVGTASYSAAGSGVVDVAISLQNLSYASQGSFCAGESGTGGTISASWHLRAKSSGGNPVSLGLSETLPDGIYLTGSAGSARLEAERYPVNLRGEQSSTSSFMVKSKGGTLRCSTASFSGTVASSVSTISASPSFGGCVLQTIYGAINVSVSTNGCSYQYTIAGGPSYSGQLSLSCPSGSSLEAKGNGCVLTVSGQPLGSVTYGATGSGPYRAITETVSGSSIKSSATGAFCSASGAFEGGTFAESGVIRGSTA